MFHFSTIYKQLLAPSMDACVQNMDYILSHNAYHHVQITLKVNHNFHIYLTIE
jgi:hypothetical protein